MNKIKFSKWNKSVPMYDDFQAAICDSITRDYLEKFDVLEIGVGRGGTAQKLLEKFDNVNYEGIDIDKDALKIAKETLGEKRNIKFDYFDIVDFTPQDKQYDCVISALTLHHLTDSEKLNQLKKIRKWLRNDGVFVWGDLVKLHSEKMNQKATKMFSDYRQAVLSEDEKEKVAEHIKNDLHNFQTIEEMKESLVLAGFKDVDLVWDYYRLVAIRASV
jgi:tRNA (cmo5U34)-methyltransferase